MLTQFLKSAINIKTEQGFKFIDNLKRFLKPEGNLIISGFKKNMQNNILKLYDKFFDIIDNTDENDWCCSRMLKNES